MSRLWPRRGKNDAGRQLLTEIYSCFKEEFDTCGLKEAKEVLEKNPEWGKKSCRQLTDLRERR
jgi:hypothetical protein